jgi:hypothetical protein
MAHIVLSHGSHRAVTWLTPRCHMAHIVLSHGLHRAVTWLTLCCHMAYTALSYGSHRAVTWLTSRCHMAYTAPSHGSHRAVTWLPRACLQGSNDLQHWLDLRRHTGDTTIRLPGQYGSWPVGGPAACMPFRAFRLLLTGPTQVC